jgi:exodeoxyribonuclease III
MEKIDFPREYFNYYDCCTPPHKGYSGVQILTKYEPISIRRGLENIETDWEGRVLTLEYDQFFLVNTYVPNSG